MSYSLSEAATACGVYKSTILRSIKAGRLTGTKDALGQWRIEPAELHRVYAPAQRNGAESNGARPGATAALVVEVHHRAELAEQRLAMLALVLDDLRVQRDKWQQQAERLAITDARARQPWWRRLAA
jgi:excisionase family DNA binding protein